MLKIKCGKKSYAGFLLVKVPRQLAPRLEIITPTKTRKPLKQQDLLASVTIGQDFPGKASHCNTFFYLVWSSSIQDVNIIAKDKTRIKKLLAPRIFACSGSSADAKIFEAVCPNQEPLSLLVRLFFFFWQNGGIFFLGPAYSFSLVKDLFLLLIFP